MKMRLPSRPMFVYAVMSLLRLPMPAAIGTVSALSVDVLYAIAAEPGFANAPFESRNRPRGKPCRDSQSRVMFMNTSPRAVVYTIGYGTCESAVGAFGRVLISRSREIAVLMIEFSDHEIVPSTSVTTIFVPRGAT